MDQSRNNQMTRGSSFRRSHTLLVIHKGLDVTLGNIPDKFENKNVRNTR